MNSIRCRVALAVSAFLIVTCCPLQNALAQTSIPEEMSALLKNFEGALQDAITKKKDDKVAAQLEALRIREPEKWFVVTFGQENGGKLASFYDRSEKKDESGIIDYFLSHGQPAGQVVASIASGGSEPQKTEFLQRVDDAIRKAAQAPLIVYRMQYVWTGLDGKSNPSYFLGFLVSIGETYHRIPDGVLRELPGMPPMRVRQGGAVTSAALLYRVDPVYPIEARQTGVSGTVRLHAIIGQDGLVRDLIILSGDPLLAQSALDAVRQWRYRPTLLEGKPVEVDTTIDIVFSLGQR